MKHNILKIFFISLILLLGVSNAWAKRYYFEVPDIDAWKGENALYAVRLCKGASINTGTSWARLTKWDENTYYMDFKSTTYTHFQFCRMKDNITSLEGSSWMNLVHTSCYTMPSPIPTDNDEPNLLTVGSVGDYDNSNETQTYSAVWIYQTFTVENVHIIFEASHRFWKYQPTDSEFQNELQPVLLIGDNSSSQTIALTKIQNANNIYHCHIQDPVSFAGYTFIQPAEVDINPDIDDNKLPFHARCALIDQIIDTYHTNIKYNEEETYQDIISKKHEDPRTYNLIVNTTKQRTKSYFEPISGNTFHCIRLGDFIDSKTYFGDINNLNKNLTIEVKVSYDDGKTYEQTGTLPVDLYSTDQNNYDIKEKIFYFTDSWTNMSQYSTLNLPSGSKTFSYTTPMGYKANNVYITYNIPQENEERYEVVKWIMNNTESYSTNRIYSPGYFEEENPVITLYIKKIGDWKCTVTFNTEQLSNITIAPLEVEPNEKIAAPLIDKELQPAGMVCKWYTHPTERGTEYEFDFDTRITQDYTLYGAWVPEAEVGDYRLLYVEQVVEKGTGEDYWKTVITRKKAHPSDIIKKRTTTGTDIVTDIVSLHVYNKNTYEGIRRYVDDTPEYYTSPSNSAVVLQQYNNEGQWVDIEHHMVFGPLEALPGHALLPGRQEVGGDITSIEELIEQLRADYGIPNIVNAEDHRYKGNGVWNFPIQQTVGNDGKITAKLLREEVVPYTGTYYIRTANAKGGWNNYKNNSDNHMTKSKYQTSLAIENEEFTQYNCKRVELDKLDSKFVHFVVANDYAQAISDTLIADRADILGNPLNAEQIIVGNNAELPENANLNIRFSWKEENNALHRAYISHAEADKTNFLLLNDIAGGNLSGIQPFNYNDHNHYQTVLNAKPNATVSLTATYNSETQNLKGKNITLFEGNEGDKNTYPIHALYNFGENQISTFYLPHGTDFAGEAIAIETDVMIVRKNHEQANQLLLTEKARTINTGKTAYGALTFTYEHLSSNNWAAANDKTFYWISFPFDVNLSDAFGFGKYAVHWYIEYYDGAERAKNGLFLDSGTYWKYVTKSQAKEYILQANTGYVLWLNVPRIQSDGLLNNYNAKEITLFFPSKEPIQGEFSSKETVVNLPAYWRPEERRKKEDSNWHLIGVPSYANTKMSTTLTEPNGFYFLYDYKPESDTYKATSTEELTYQSMFAYMVQHYGEIHWLTAIKDHESASLAARQDAAAEDKKMLRLELHHNGTRQDKTYIGFQNDDATTAFDMNKDLTKIINLGANIYSITSDNVDVAGNIIPMEEATLMLGVNLQTAGEYTFAMPEGTEGMVVELIDYETNTRTNLLLDNYTVTLPAGINETRFALSIKPDKVATSVENVGEADNHGEAARKYLIDGQLYLQKDGTVYDAQGRSL